MMLRGLLKLTWIETKIFLREPLGAFGTIGFPVLVFMVLGRFANPKPGRHQSPSAASPAPAFQFSYRFLSPSMPCSHL